MSDRLTGSVLPGTVVIIKGTNIGTVADKQGKYSIKVADENATLVFSHVGYKTQEIPIANNAIINVQWKLTPWWLTSIKRIRLM